MLYPACNHKVVLLVPSISSVVRSLTPSLLYNFQCQARLMEGLGAVVIANYFITDEESECTSLVNL